jgi:hypothetical protein
MSLCIRDTRYAPRLLLLCCLQFSKTFSHLQGKAFLFLCRISAYKCQHLLVNCYGIKKRPSDRVSNRKRYCTVQTPSLLSCTKIITSHLGQHIPARQLSVNWSTLTSNKNEEPGPDIHFNDLLLLFLQAISKQKIFWKEKESFDHCCKTRLISCSAGHTLFSILKMSCHSFYVISIILKFYFYCKLSNFVALFNRKCKDTQISVRALEI